MLFFSAIFSFSLSELLLEISRCKENLFHYGRNLGAQNKKIKHIT
jgi:hypothetical protein